ncbi:MAG: 4Fe-4S dicluster domain-containing protein [Bacillota bacterium]
MKFKKLNSDQLINFIEYLADEYKVIAPFQVEDGRLKRTLLKELENKENIPAIYLKEMPDTAPKNFLLPREETLASDKRGADFKPDRWAEEKRVFFGIRSCDLSAVQIFDDVFLEDDFQDPFYKSRRENSLFIAYANQNLPQNNFQQSLGIDFFEHELASLFLYEDLETEDEYKYYLKVKENELSEEVNDFIDSLKDFSEEKINELLGKWRNKIEESNEFEIESSLPFPEEEAFNKVNWFTPTSSCLGCGVCTFYCPTCFCFHFYWEGKERQRGWDSCMFSLFTQHASGHNPREEQHQRWRQRLMHKFSYHPANFGEAGCVGCGRCINKCPVNLDIRKVINAVDTTLREEVTENES